MTTDVREWLPDVWNRRVERAGIVQISPWRYTPLVGDLAGKMVGG
jgi:hypothetical protein